MDANRTKPQLQSQSPPVNAHHSKRRQYHSCDKCRKGRRACDAVARGVQPLQQGHQGDDGQPKACSICLKSNSKCTFEWLRKLPEASLPRAMKRKRSDPRNPPAKQQVPSKRDSIVSRDSDNSLSVAKSELGEDLLHGDKGFPPTEYNAPDLAPALLAYEWSHATLQTLLTVDSLRANELRPAESFQMNDSVCEINTPQYPIQSLEGQDVPEHDRYQSASQRRDSEHSHVGSPRSKRSKFSQGTKKSQSPMLVAMQQDYSGGHDAFASTPRFTSPTWTSSQSPISPTQHHEQFLTFDSQTPSVSSIVFTSDSPTTRANETGVNLLNDSLAQSTNKSMIIAGLSQIYQDSLENSLKCWITEENCPYERSLTSRAPDGVDASAAAISLYQRGRHLEVAFSPLRPKPLSAAESVGTSRALKLAIMAFASQWSHSSYEKGFRVYPEEHRDEFPHDNSRALIGGVAPAETESAGFEVGLRESLWNEAQRCLDRWEGCDSILMIMAQIIFALTETPSKPDDGTVIGSTTQPSSSTFKDSPEAKYPTQGIPDGNLSPYWDGISPNFLKPAFETPLYSTSENQTESKEAEGRLKHLENALNSLLMWKKRIELTMAYDREDTCETKTYSEAIAPQNILNFKMLFWLGVMADTTSSVINRRQLVIPDSDTIFKSNNIRIESCLENQCLYDAQQHYCGQTGAIAPESEINIWGSNYLISRSKLSSEFWSSKSHDCMTWREKMLQQATPIKTLLWRKASILQTLLSKPTTAKTFELHIRESLQVYEHWVSTYQDFFDDCVSRHQSLPFKIQSWYIVLGTHWHLAGLHIARCIQQIDENYKSESLQRALRQSSCLVQEIQKACSFAVAAMARVSCLDTASAIDGEQFHFAVRQAAILTEPWTDVLYQSLTMACDRFLVWRRSWQDQQMLLSMSPHQDWVYSNTDIQELSAYCTNCINALRILGQKSDLATQRARDLSMELFLAVGI